VVSGPTSYFASGFQLFYPPRVIPICHFGLPCSCPHIPIVHSRIPALPVISHVRVIPTAVIYVYTKAEENEGEKVDGDGQGGGDFGTQATMTSVRGEPNGEYLDNDNDVDNSV